MKLALYASARMKYIQGRDLLSPIDLEDVRKLATQAESPSTPLQATAATFVEYFLRKDLSESLQANVHIPVLVSMYAFVRDKFAFRFESPAEARVTLAVDAIETMLPVEDKAVGRELLRKFVESWKYLADVFGTFHICGREVRAGAEIPLVDQTNLHIGDLVELGKKPHPRY